MSPQDKALEDELSTGTAESADDDRVVELTHYALRERDALRARVAELEDAVRVAAALLDEVST